MLYATALTPDSMTDNFSNLERRETFVALGREVMATARAVGVQPRSFNGFEPADFMPDATRKNAFACLARLAEFNSKTAKTHSGVWRDLAVRKRRTDVDHMVGIVAKIAAEHAVETPVLDRLGELIHEIEEGLREMSAETFSVLAKEVKS